MEDMVLRPKKLSVLVFLVSSVLFVVLGIFTISTKTHGSLIFGISVILFFGAIAVIFLISLLPNASYLKLTDKGFEVKSIFRGYFLKWSDVEEFKVVSISGEKFVGFNYSSSFTKQEIARNLGKSLSGVEGMLPNNYSKKPEELAKLMNSLNKKFSNIG